MTATDTSTWQACRHCGTPIHPSALSSCWIDQRDYDTCDDAGTSHEPATICRVVDQITEWTSPDRTLRIHEGDLILRDHRLEVVERLYYDPADIMVRVELAGHSAAMWAQPGDLVAVRRYLIEETP